MEGRWTFLVIATTVCRLNYPQMHLLQCQPALASSSEFDGSLKNTKLLFVADAVNLTRKLNIAEEKCF